MLIWIGIATAWVACFAVVIVLVARAPRTSTISITGEHAKPSIWSSNIAKSIWTSGSFTRSRSFSETNAPRGRRQE